jgi:hypothetical protein
MKEGTEGRLGMSIQDSNPPSTPSLHKGGKNKGKAYCSLKPFLSQAVKLGSGMVGLPIEPEIFQVRNFL